MKTLLNSRSSILLLLLLMFIAPGVTAWFLYTHQHFMRASTTNKGQLMHSAVAFDLLGHPEKWKLVFWNPQGCDLHCAKQLDKLARVRLALGRRLYNVDEWLLLSQDAASPSKVLLNQLKQRDIAFKFLVEDGKGMREALSDQPAIYIVSPDNHLVLSYALDAPPDHVYKDLKHLLSAYETRGGGSHAS